MIIKGFSISRGSAHAAHLLKTDDNEHVHIQEIRGFVASDLPSAFQESQAIARGTRCKQHLFSCAFSPPESAKISTAQFMASIDKTEQALGLEGQPRVVVFHEKDGRCHAHCVWSRIDADTMTARQLSHWKTKLGDVSRALHAEFGIEMPKGLRKKEERDPLNFSQADSQRAKREHVDPRQLKSIVLDCWAKSDNRKSFEVALEGRCLLLAKGDKRGFVIVDYEGQVHSLSRALGGKAKNVNAKLGDPSSARSVDEAKRHLAAKLGHEAREDIKRSRERFTSADRTLKSAIMDMTRIHRDERAKLWSAHSAQWLKSTLERQARLPRGLVKIAWSWMTGDLARIKTTNENEAKEQSARQQREREEMMVRQREERRVLQMKATELRKAQAQELLRLRRDLSSQLRQPRADAPSRQSHAMRLNLKLDR